MLGLPDRHRERLPAVEPLKGWSWKMNLLDYRKDTWRKGQEPFETVNPRGRGTAVVVCDSFAHALVPFFGESFERVIYIWDRRYFAEAVTLFKPDTVIDEVVERALVPTDPASLHVQ
jgi:hypothetical protein